MIEISVESVVFRKDVYARKCLVLTRDRGMEGVSKMTISRVSKQPYTEDCRP